MAESKKLANSANAPLRREGGNRAPLRRPKTCAAAKARVLTLAVCGILLSAVALVFIQTTRFAFLSYDDSITVYANPEVARGLTLHGVGWAFANFQLSNWIPLTCLSHMLDCQMYRLNAGGHHLTNVLLHAATAVLLFLVLRQMTHRFWPSALAAALFALHPLRAESVAWVTERKDVLSGLFFMLALAAYVDYVRHRPSLRRYLVVIVLFLFGLWSKPMLVTLPAVLLLLDYWPLGRFPSNAPARGTLQQTPPHGNGGGALATHVDSLPAGPRPFSFPWQLVIEKLPLVLLAMVICAVTPFAQGGAVTVNEQYPFWWRVGNALLSYITYLRLSFYPAGLAALYPRLGLSLPFWRVFVAFLALASITVAAWVWRRKRPYLLVGWLWYLGMLVPVIGVVQFGSQAVADRFTYLPHIGLSIALVWGAADVCRAVPRWRWACGGASALLLAVLMGCAWRQASFWHDSEILWSHALACTSRNDAAHNNLAVMLIAQQRFDEAIMHCQEALRINPGRDDTHFNMALALSRRGRLDEAILHCQQGLKIEPGDVKAHRLLSGAFAARRRFGESIAQLEQAVQLAPDDLDVQMNLAWMRATCADAALRNGTAAIEHAQRAVELCGGQRVPAYDVLAAAYAEAGRFPEAVAAARKGLDLAVQQNARPVADTMRGRMALYQAGKPLRQGSAAARPAP